MKKLFLLSVAALVTFAACQKEINPAKQEAGITALTATVEQQVGDTKTALVNSKSVVWSEGDVIKVWNASNESGNFTLTEGASTTQGTFNGDEIADPLYAFYPASAVSSVESSEVTFTLPATQHYIANTFDNGANIAVAKISGNSMQFKNVCGVLKLQLKGTTIVKSIVVKGKNNEKLNGEYTVNAGFETEPDMPCVTTETESEKAITLDCGNGVLLDPASVTNFYVVVPKGAFANGFDVTIEDKFNASDNILTTKANTINRNTLLSMPEKCVEIRGFILPGAFSVSDTKQVRFASGNLQATIDEAGVPTSWRFAETQYSRIGNAGANRTIGSAAGDIDLFCYSTDGEGAGVGYKPWGVNVSLELSNYYGSFRDWGSNPMLIETLTEIWRTPSRTEWTYLLNTRSASTINGTDNARYAAVQVNDVKGLLLFPDSFAWTPSMGTAPTTFNTFHATWNNVNYSATEFNEIELAGGVFLPAGEWRNGSGVMVDNSGRYWSSSIIGVNEGSHLQFSSSEMVIVSSSRFRGHSVRLVKDL